MLGRSHAIGGALVGITAGQAVGLHSIPALAPFALTTAGYALASDLDHPRASATTLLGPVTGAISWGLRKTSAFCYHHTLGPKDDSEDAGTHRHLTHTLVFCLVLGALAEVSALFGGGGAVLGWVLFGALMAGDRLGRIAWLAFAAGVIAWISGAASLSIPAFLAGLEESSPWLGLAVFLGCFMHVLCDAVTRSGVPILWPIPIHGQHWYRLGPPKPLRLYTGHWPETVLVAPAMAVACVLAMPGMIESLLA
jgi:membrane-bound metal-dependent hydrolase YbcI (DUF457 family)